MSSPWVGEEEGVPVLSRVMGSTVGGTPYLNV